MLTAECIEAITSIAKKVNLKGELHEPIFCGKEKEYLNACIETREVSSIGDYVYRFAQELCDYTGAKHAIPVVNGTCALYLALKACGIGIGDIVLTQALTFVGTLNAIRMTGAFVMLCDVDNQGYIDIEHVRRAVSTYNIKAIIPVNVQGLPGKAKILKEEFRDQYIIEDAAEALGSWEHGRHAGTIGHAGIISFNGNKVITTGGGGAVLTNDDEIADKVYRLSTQAKLQHEYEYEHDIEAGNFRMPNINAALGCAQMAELDKKLKIKREIYERYKKVFDQYGCDYLDPDSSCDWNCWLVTLIASDYEERQWAIKEFRERGLKVRPLWKPHTEYGIYRHCAKLSSPNARRLYDTAISLPSMGEA